MKRALSRPKAPQAAQMVHDLREQMVSQRFEDLDRIWSSGEGGTQLPPSSAVSAITTHHPNGRLTSSGPPHLKS
ncbi:hypothetical protein KIN20_028758 [Parelaphostrongylus tenuis]|uniref:Uncharacterized protein n=1 Tax=Parelaphostrongylus tenuis TaxID=148309 RepID=A0AAD5R1B8_PARTN|nr:hypothetical protein KIN20_028758 [Parelaphostrongylus tenuis]